jgi:hypothetical protein
MVVLDLVRAGNGPNCPRSPEAVLEGLLDAGVECVQAV